MSDLRDLPIAHAARVSSSAPVRPVSRDLPTSTGAPVDLKHGPGPSTVAATTDGNLRQAYAQFLVDPTTHDTVIRIRDANTNAVISETPSPEIQAMTQAMKAYANTVARHQAAVHAAPQV